MIDAMSRGDDVHRKWLFIEREILLGMIAESEKKEGIEDAPKEGVDDGPTNGVEGAPEDGTQDARNDEPDQTGEGTVKFDHASVKKLMVLKWS